MEKDEEMKNNEQSENNKDLEEPDVDTVKKTVIYKRYYHVFKKGEIE